VRVFVTGWDGLLGTDGTGIDDGDICNREALRVRLEAFRPDALVHLAAMTAVDLCETEEDEAFRVNGEGSRVAAAQAEALGIPILAVSSDYVFDGAKGEPYDEDDVPNPLSVYGRSKLAGEEAVKAAALQWTLVRSAWLYGEGGRNFVDTMGELVKTRDVVSVVDDQIGSPTYAWDLAHGIRTLLEAGSRGVVHVANSGEASWYELARETAITLGLDPERIVAATTEELGRPAPRPAYSVLGTRRAEALYGLEMRSWREALRSYLETNPAA
jgi:dTDP-4-dehydrorhamnose reductase